MTRMQQVLGLAGWILLSFLPAWVGSQVTDPSWYQDLRQPSWAPPTWLFGPVWTVLYLLMGTAAWLVWRQRGFAAARGALVLYLVQLIFNGTWTWIFFGLQRPALAFAEIIVLWILIAATALAFAKHSLPAAWLLAPYLAWVTFAAVLNFSLWQLNPAAPDTAQVATAPTSPQSGVDQLRWMSGCWESTSSAMITEEHWMVPRGASMSGTSRTVRGESTVAHEALRIHDDAGTLVYSATPSGQSPAAFRSILVSDSVVVFENLNHDFPQRIRYRRAGRDSLVARIEGSEGGRERSIDFPMRRAQCN
jgi:translocator protein